MCGIAGIIHFDGTRVEGGILERMVDLIRNRGPDASAFYFDEQAGLGHARLSIIDLTSSGKQPMSNEDGSLWIVFNGEIFNYLELREELLRQGHRFSSRTDTEVILHLFEEEGERCVERLNGQWAFAIWDLHRKKLFLSRDRLGIRPLFYTRIGRAFVFGSEIKALFAHPRAAREVDLAALDQIFTYWCTLPPRTFFKNVFELPPGHSMAVEEERVRVWPYWRLDYPREAVPGDERDCAGRLRELLIDATRLQLRADVPVGAYLSGGLDSTAIVSLIKNFTGTPLKTFSVTFEDPEFDESGYQREAIRFLETDHQEVRCAYADIGRVFPEVVWHAEKPIIRTAPAPLYLLSGLVRQNGYKVVLTGEGSDELLGGYDIFKEAKIRRFWGKYPESRLRPLLLKRLYPYLQNLQSQSAEYLKSFFHVRPEDLASPFFSHFPRWELTAKLKLFFSDAVKAELRGRSAYAGLEALLPEGYGRWDGFSQAQYLETALLLPGYILSSQGDRMAMAHSVEGRFPFLDHRVAEFAARLPPRFKMKALDEKHILKRAMSGLVPRAVLARPKQPYRAPEVQSFFGAREKPLELPYVERLLSSEVVKEYGIFNPEGVKNLVAKAKSGKIIGIKDSMAVVGILSAQLVVEQFIKKVEKWS